MSSLPETDDPCGPMQGMLAAAVASQSHDGAQLDSDDLGGALDLRAINLRDASLTVIGPKAHSVYGDPVESELILYKDAGVEMGIWEVTPGVFRGRKDGCVELMHFVTGAGTITDESGKVTEIHPDVVALLPDGWSGTWNVTATLRKTFVIYNARRKDDR